MKSDKNHKVDIFHKSSARFRFKMEDLVEPNKGTCSKSAIETVKKGVKYVQSL